MENEEYYKYYGSVPIDIVDYMDDVISYLEDEFNKVMYE